MARLVILSGRFAGTEFELREGRNTLGRHPGNDVVIAEEAVSGRHCDVWVSGLQVRVRDLRSRNGTFLRGGRVATAELRDGDVLVLGDIAVRVESPPPEVRIPQWERETERRSVWLADGTPACLNHPDQPAAFHCTQCDRYWCGACLKALRLVGGSERRFCPVCSGACRTLHPAAESREKSPRFSKLLSSFKRAFTWRSPKQ